jgi:hypothetical protein
MERPALVCARAHISDRITLSERGNATLQAIIDASATSTYLSKNWLVFFEFPLALRCTKKRFNRLHFTHRRIILFCSAELLQIAGSRTLGKLRGSCFDFLHANQGENTHLKEVLDKLRKLCRAKPNAAPVPSHARDRPLHLKQLFHVLSPSI